MLPTNLAIRLAGRLQHAWASVSKTPIICKESWRRYQHLTMQVKKLQRQIEYAEESGYRASLKVLQQQFNAHLIDLYRVVYNLREFSTPPKVVPDLHHWLAEVRQLEDEFDEVTVEWKTQTLRVVTEPITLEDVYLGSFAIEFVWSRYGTYRDVLCFDIIALEPHPSAVKREIVHPHVQEQTLCAGEAARPINGALEGGRIADALVLIRSVLTTYNRDSPYALLKEWDGRPCSDCGSTMQNDESYSCDNCEADLCSGCSSMCDVCETTFCVNCVENCELCESSCCRRCREVRDKRLICKKCIEVCSDCRSRVPKDKFNSETDLCFDCQPPEEEEPCYTAIVGVGTNHVRDLSAVSGRTELEIAILVEFGLADDVAELHDLLAQAYLPPVPSD